MKREKNLFSLQKEKFAKKISIPYKVSVVFLITLIPAVLFFLFFRTALGDVLANRSLEVKSTAPPSPAAKSWTLASKITEAKGLVKNLELKVGTKDISYTEKRVTVNAGNIRVSDVKLKDPERQIGLVLLDKNTGKLKAITITKRGAQLISPAGYDIRVVERPSGLRWNYWGTQYKVNKPANNIVILNKWPEPDTKQVTQVIKQKNGKNKTVTTTKKTTKYIVYSSYNDELRTPEMVSGGDQYIKNIVSQAFQELKDRNVPSRAYSGKLVADVSTLSPAFFIKLPLLEQSDLGEFMLDPKEVSEKIKTVLMANGSYAYSQTCSGAGACGWIQFTPGTYKMIARAYPAANLSDDFKSGAANHLNSMMAAILLYDYNLKGLMDRHGQNIANDTKLEEYLAASYNGSPMTVTKSLNSAISQGLSDWVDKLLPETKGYMTKIRFLNS